MLVVLAGKTVFKKKIFGVQKESESNYLEKWRSEHRQMWSHLKAPVNLVFHSDGLWGEQEMVKRSQTLPIMVEEPHSQRAASSTDL